MFRLAVGWTRSTACRLAHSAAAEICASFFRSRRLEYGECPAVLSHHHRCRRRIRRPQWRNLRLAAAIHLIHDKHSLASASVSWTFSLFCHLYYLSTMETSHLYAHDRYPAGASPSLGYAPYSEYAGEYHSVMLFLPLDMRSSRALHVLTIH